MHALLWTTYHKKGHEWVIITFGRNLFNYPENVTTLEKCILHTQGGIYVHWYIKIYSNIPLNGYEYMCISKNLIPVRFVEGYQLYQKLYY